jgi:hypothetical protein
MPLTEKKDAGNIYTDLHIIRKEQSSAGSGYDTITLSVPDQGKDFLPNFRIGDMVYLYTYKLKEEPDVRKAILYKGVLQEIHSDEIVVHLTDGQQNADIFEMNLPYAIEHGTSDASTGGSIRNLHQFIETHQVDPGYHSYQLEPHYVQLLLYYGVLQHNFKLSNDRVNIRLLYSKYQPQDGLMVVAYYQKLFKEAIEYRNQLVAASFEIAKEGFEHAYMKESFSSYPNISVDFGVLDKPSNVYMMKCDFGWADLGTWHSIYEAMQKSSDDNVVIDSDVMMENCHNNVIKLPKGKLAVLNGLDGFIVAENDNVLLICKKEDSSALVRKYVNEVQMKKGDEFV